MCLTSSRLYKARKTYIDTWKLAPKPSEGVFCLPTEPISRNACGDFLNLKILMNIFCANASFEFISLMIPCILQLASFWRNFDAFISMILHPRTGNFYSATLKRSYPSRKITNTPTRSELLLIYWLAPCMSPCAFCKTFLSSNRSMSEIWLDLFSQIKPQIILRTTRTCPPLRFRYMNSI